MNQHTYKLKLIGDVPEGISIKKEKEISYGRDWFGHSFGMKVGLIYDDDERKESLFIHDYEAGNTEWFDKLLESGILRKRHRNLFDEKTLKKYGCDEYYVMYNIVDHLSLENTVTTECLDTYINVNYEYTYEILFVGDEDYRRYLYHTIHTSGPNTYGLIDEIANLESLFEEWAKDKKYGLSNSCGISLKMYNEYGEEIDAEYESTRALLMAVNSVRIVRMKSKIVK